MSYTVTGRLIDKDKNPIEFAKVFTSDSNGKPIAGTKFTETDLQGRWKLDGIKDSDFITGQMVGFKKKTISAKSIITIPNFITGIPQRSINITLDSSEQAALPEVAVEGKKITIKPSNIGKYIIFGSIGILAITGIILLIRKK
jgi:hypothetical protein